jgi:phage replication O-like protein O
MANPQIEDGHVDLANEIVEALAKIRISGEEMQCLWVIFRKTYGWHKKNDHISLSQFSQFTTLKKPNICHALSKLLSKKIISVAKKDNGITSYGFNKDFDIWVPLPKKITLPKKIMTIAKKGNESLPILAHTKETIQKKLLQKQLSDEDFLVLLKSMFTWVDFDKEMVKIDAWIMANPGRQKTRRFMVKWISKVEKPLEIQKSTKPIEPVKYLDRDGSIGEWNAK